MARYQAIAATSAALLGLIEERYPRADFGPGLRIETLTPVDLETAPTDNGFALVLWRVTINKELRARAPRRNALGEKFKPSLPLDLHYLIVPFSTSAEQQQRMLGWVMRMFADVGHIAAAQLNFNLLEDDVFPATEDVELVADPLPLADHLTLWERMKRFPAYASYQLRMVLIDSDVSMSENAPVLEREFAVGGLEQ